MGSKFFSRGASGRTLDAPDEVGASEITLEGRDQQQALVLGALRGAAGAPVSYAELREAGVDLPASVVSELELAGVPIQRCLGDSGGAGGVRLDPRNDPAARKTSDRSQPPKPTRSRVLALTALLAAIAVLSSVVAVWASGGGRGTQVPIARRPQPRATAAAHGRRPTGKPRATHPSPPVPVSPALAAELEAQGHSLLEDGRYGVAVPVLKQAVLATGETLDACLEPGSSTCLTYAYALYDLGRAVRLSGDPQAAVPILERRLQIDNQRSVVVAELQLARQGIG